jgi:molybdopterin converting factor small subunit
MHVRVIAPFEIKRLDSEDRLELPEGTTIRGLIGLTGLALTHIWVLPVFVNGERVSRSHRLKDGDLVVFLNPTAGG